MSNAPQRRTGSGTVHHRVNIGVIVFTAIFFYMAANSILYLTRGHVSFFEVEQGQIVDRDRFTGFILRDEKEVKSSENGYISFYVNNGEKAARNENVCLISKAQAGKKKSASYTLTKEDRSDIREQMLDFLKSYSDRDYAQVQDFDYDMSTIVNRAVSRNDISTASAGKTSSYQAVTADACGVISYTVDGLEGTSKKSITEETFSKAGSYSRKQTEAGSYVKASDPLFKVIKSDRWSIIIEPDEEQLERLQKMIDKAGDQSVPVEVEFVRQGFSTQADAEIFKNKGRQYVSLTIDDYMNTFCNDRYVDINLVWNSFSGMKIPAKSIAKKDFYMIPSEYLVTDSSSDQKGFYIKGGSGTEFIKPDVVLTSDDYCYVDHDDMASGTVLVNNKTGKTYSVSSTAALDGVYNINRGYTQFCPIKILYTYGDYCIIENASSNLISLYDRILLDGSDAHDGEVVY